MSSINSISSTFSCKKKLLLWMILTQLMWNEASAACRSVARHVNQLLRWMPLVWPPPNNNSDHQTNYYIFSREFILKDKNHLETAILGRGVRLHPRYATLTLTWKQKICPRKPSPGRSGAFREVRGVKDAMAARGASRFFSGRRCPPFLGPRSPADDMFWQQGIPMQK